MFVSTFIVRILSFHAVQVIVKSFALTRIPFQSVDTLSRSISVMCTWFAFFDLQFSISSGRFHCRNKLTYDRLTIAILPTPLAI